MLSEAPVKGGGAGGRAIFFFFFFLYTQPFPYTQRSSCLSPLPAQKPLPAQIHQRIPGICGSSFPLLPAGTISR
jgi:hypothetical protein